MGSLMMGLSMPPISSASVDAPICSPVSILILPVIFLICWIFIAYLLMSIFFAQSHNSNHRAPRGMSHKLYKLQLIYNRLQAGI